MKTTLNNFSKCLVKIKDCILDFTNVNEITYNYDDDYDYNYKAPSADDPYNDCGLKCVIKTKPENSFVELDEFLLCLVFEEKCIVFPKCKNENGEIVAKFSKILNSPTYIFYVPQEKLYKYTGIDLARIEMGEEKQMQQKQHTDMKEKCHIMIVDHNLTIDEFVEHLEKIRKKTGSEVEIGQIFQISKR